MKLANSQNEAKSPSQAQVPKQATTMSHQEQNSIASLLLSLPTEIRLGILSRAVYMETGIRVHKKWHYSINPQLWNMVEDDILSNCPIPNGKHDQLYHEAFELYF